MTTLRELRSLILAGNITLFLVSADLQKSYAEVGGSQHKFALEGGKWVDGVGEEVSQPGFKRVEDVRYGYKTQQYLAYPVLKEEEVVCVVQCEAKVQKKTGKNMGFQVADEQILKIFCYYLQMRLERRVALRELKMREQAVVDTLRLTSEICTQRHHEGLFRKMKENLPDFFGFESVGVLIYNFKTNWLFTDPD